ncbi:MAG: hypothetical protein Q4A74_02020 [Cardiobacteriaceae bacterium]|nr:hypothetical protein [Cardiobacteriaceae bacterium]
MWRAHLYKEYRLLGTPVFFIALAISWFALGWFLVSGLLEYQAIAAKLAGLENKRGATETLLGSASRVLQWLMILWSIYFGARCLASERLWHTDALLYGVRGGFYRLVFSKILVLMSAQGLLCLPFWLFAYWLSLSSAWDHCLLVALALAQVFLVFYTTLLSLVVSATQKQPLPASLLLALLWLLLWLLPVLTTTPLWLVEILRWFSPFEHIALLHRGIASMQTLIFFVIHCLFFATLIPLFWTRETS